MAVLGSDQRVKNTNVMSSGREPCRREEAALIRRIDGPAGLIDWTT